MKTFVILCLSLFLFGCETPEQVRARENAPPPQINITGFSKKQIIDEIVSSMLAKGTRIVNVNDYGVTGAKKSDSIVDAVLFGSRYDSTPEARIHLNLVETKDGVRVFARAEIITNPGSAFERVRDMTYNARNELGNLLGDLSLKLNRAKVAEEKSQTPKPTPQIGKDSYAAAEVAKSLQCHHAPQPSMIASGPGFESYRIPCLNGTNIDLRCEFGICSK